MNKLFTALIVTLFASTAAAQISTIPGTGIIMSTSTVSPVITNHVIHYPAGTPYVDGTGRPRACGTALIVTHNRGYNRASCNDGAQTTAQTADNFATMAPAAGGNPERRLLSDNALAADSRTSLRSDRIQ